MRTPLLLLAALVALPAAHATSTVLWEFHGDLGPAGSALRHVVAPAGTVEVRAVFVSSASTLPEPVMRWSMRLDEGALATTCEFIRPSVHGWTTCTLSMTMDEPLSAAHRFTVSHAYQGVFHADILVTARS
ncbi:MAG TPA: hypothetical protein VFH78_05440 [Candidatus Thermoplasmatota archaeon]|nr:hypothetical protein [Candidatus Thermoplasmatota archaeon]